MNGIDPSIYLIVLDLVGFVIALIWAGALIGWNGKQ